MGNFGVGSRIRSALNYKKPLFWVIIIAVIAIAVIAVILCPSFKTSEPTKKGNEVTEEGTNAEQTVIPDGKTENSEPDDPPKAITVDLPFPDMELLNLNGEYVSPDFISFDEFEWGDYYPLLKYEAEDGIYGYALLTEGISELNEAINSYCLYENSGKSILDIGIFKEDGLDQRFPDKHLRAEEIERYNSYFYNGEYRLENIGETNDISVLDFNGTEKYRLMKEAKLTVNRDSLYLTVEQILDDRYLLVHAIFSVGDYAYYYHRPCTMLFDLETEEYTFLVGDAMDPILSPDRRYLAYTLDYVDENDYFCGRGYYVLDLKTHKTLYVQHPGDHSYFFVNWIPRDKYEETVPHIDEKAELDEISVSFLNKHIYLGHKDGDTKEVAVDFPADFPYGPYSEDNIVPSDEFDWGGWALLGSRTVGYFTNSDVILDYVLMSETTSDIEEAEELYKEYNSRYLVKTDPKFDYDIKDSTFESFIYDSRITHISEDGSEVIRRIHTDENTKLEEDSWYGNMIDGSWKANYEWLNNGVVQKIVTTTSSFYDLECEEIEADYSSLPDYVPPLEYYRFWRNLYDGCVTYESRGKVIIYSSDSKKLLWEITLPYEETDLSDTEFRISSMELRDFVDHRYLILEMTSYVKSKENDWYFRDYVYGTYSYDLLTGEYILLAPYCSGYSIIISPDRKYVAYDSLQGEPNDIDYEENNLIAMKPGFYIRNIETGETVAFHIETGDETPLCFTKWESIKKTLESGAYYTDTWVKFNNASEQNGIEASANSPKIPEPFLSVLKNEKPFYGNDGKEMYFAELYDYTLDKFVDKECKYTFVDMNGDGREELLIQGIDTLVLSDQGDSVFGFQVTFRYMSSIQTNGVFYWNTNAGNVYGASKYNADWTSEELYSEEHVENALYYVGGVEATEEEYNECIKKYDAPLVTYYLLEYDKLSDSIEP